MAAFQVITEGLIKRRVRNDDENPRHEAGYVSLGRELVMLKVDRIVASDNRQFKIS